MPPREIKVGNYSMGLPKWAPARIALGVVFVLCGFLGFLPVLGFWMVPLGIAILSYDIPRVRLFRQRVTAWWRARKEKKEQQQ
jgi:hypothetical protein